MPEKMKQVGSRIRELRDICGHSVEDVASWLGISSEQYLRYEEDGDDIPISVLFELTNRYGVDMTEILTGKSPKLSTYCAVKKGSGTGVDRCPGYHFESLAYNFKHRIMEPLLVTVEPDNKEMSLISHGGQEFNFVVEGAVMVILGDEEIVLEAGDCIYFDPALPHGQKALNGRPARFLTVIAE
ncbi:MAG: cupin domain-containing protein [Clostridiales bacterium]|nr:cupin domain-containing protein [Clostridiales bacterium]